MKLPPIPNEFTGTTLTEPEVVIKRRRLRMTGDAALVDAKTGEHVYDCFGALEVLAGVHHGMHQYAWLMCQRSPRNAKRMYQTEEITTFGR